MLHVSTEYRKGVLFIRLEGRIDNECYLDNINNLIDMMGIRYVVLNLSSLRNVSLASIEHIINYNKKILKKKKLLLICDTSGIRDRLFKGIIPKIRCEIEAFSLI